MNAPPPRSNASVVWDGADGYYLLFGGENGGTILGDTWKFQDGNWSEVYSTYHPSARYGAGMTFDARDGYVMMFGGNGTSGTFNDTWSFSSGQWKHLGPSAPPRGRLFPLMAYDANLSEVIMFGGLLPYNQSAGTWAFAGGVWTQANIGGAHEPADRVGGALVYDPKAQELVMFGGWEPEGRYRVLNDTWVYVANASGGGGHWSPDNGTQAPSGRFGAAAAFDDTDNAILLFGGTSATGKPLSDSWEWNGSWVNLTGSLGIAPTARSGAAMAPSLLPGLSPSASLLAPFLFGGWSSSGSIASGEWFFGSLPLSVLPPVLTPPVQDEGIPGTFTVMAFGGNSTFYDYSWKGLPSSCVPANSSIVHCTPPVSGVFGLSVDVTDAALSERQSNVVNWTVNPPPFITQFTALPSPIVQGSRLFITVQVSGGTLPYTFLFSGLPVGCGLVDAAQFNCTPASRGSYVLMVQVTDADGLRTSNATTLLTVTSSSTSAPATWQLVVEGLAIVAAVVVAAVLIRRKIRRGPGTMSKPANAPAPSSTSPTSPNPPVPPSGPQVSSNGSEPKAW